VNQSIRTPTRLFVLSLGLAAIWGCTWVSVTPEAEQVHVASSDSLSDCTQVGTTKARTKIRLGIFARSEKKVAQELETLARNDAPELGGNTVVAEGAVDADGMQRFAIYACPVAGDPAP
jgi:hypothetical protein